MCKITLYHGTSDKIVTPTYGYGNDKHDYGKGFYLGGCINSSWIVMA